MSSAMRPGDRKNSQTAKASKCEKLSTDSDSWNEETLFVYVDS